MHEKLCSTLYNFAEKCVIYSQLGPANRTINTFHASQCDLWLYKLGFDIESHKIISNTVGDPFLHLQMSRFVQKWVFGAKKVTHGFHLELTDF